MGPCRNFLQKPAHGLDAEEKVMLFSNEVPRRRLIYFPENSGSGCHLVYIIGAHGSINALYVGILFNDVNPNT